MDKNDIKIHHLGIFSSSLTLWTLTGILDGITFPPRVGELKWRFTTGFSCLASFMSFSDLLALTVLIGKGIRELLPLDLAAGFSLFPLTNWFPLGRSLFLHGVLFLHNLSSDFDTVMDDVFFGACLLRPCRSCEQLQEGFNEVLGWDPRGSFRFGLGVFIGPTQSDKSQGVLLCFTLLISFTEPKLFKFRLNLATSVKDVDFL